MNTLTSQIDNLNKRVVALENSELSETEAVPFIVKLYASISTGPSLRCSPSTKAKAGQKMTGGLGAVTEEIATKLNFSAFGIEAKPPMGNIGVPSEVARRPIDTITVVESSEEESVIVATSFFDEQSANDQILTSASALFNATELIGTGVVVASDSINIEKTSSKTITVSTEITIMEV